LFYSLQMSEKRKKVYSLLERIITKSVTVILLVHPNVN